MRNFISNHAGFASAHHPANPAEANSHSENHNIRSGWVLIPETPGQPNFSRVRGRRLRAFGRATVSKSVSENRWDPTTPAEFAHTPLKLAHCSLTRAIRMPLRSSASHEVSFHPVPPRRRLLLPTYHQRSAIGLRTSDKGEARVLLHSKNAAFRQPTLNLHSARTHLTASDPQIATRSWP